MTKENDKVSFKQRQIMEREEQILGVARRMFCERGFHGTNLSDVASEVGIARGTIYLHFPTKEDLLAAIIRRADEHLLQVLENVINIDDNPLDKLKKIFRQYLCTCHEYEDLIRVMSHELRRAAGNRLYEGHDQRSVTKLVERTLEEAKDMGMVDPGISTIIAARAFFSIVTVQAFKEVRECTQLEVEDIIDSAMRIFFQGITRKGL